MLEARLNRANWVVKGGVNLRAWFGSRRYSEDLDLDVAGFAPHVLRERFDKILLSVAAERTPPALLKQLKPFAAD